MKSHFLIFPVATGILSLFGPVALRGEVAADWTPGAPNPDWPHVVAAKQEGKWVPRPGWKFANSTSDDLSVVPVVQPMAITIQTDGDENLRIPPPADFLPISTFEQWRKIFGAMDSARSLITDVLGHWIDIDSSGKLVEACLEIPRQYAKSCSLSSFKDLYRQMERNAESMSKIDTFLIKQVSERAAESSGVGNGIEVDGVRILPIHASDERSFQLSFVRTQLEQLAKDAKPQKTYTVGASATLWMRNRVINMNVMQSVSSQNEVEATISRTRKRA